MTDNQIKHMINQFLMWRLPDDFNPDCGISFTRPTFNGEPYPHGPSGTNLFDYEQASKMVKKMINGLPSE